MRWVEGWGQPGSTTADLFAPSLAHDQEYRRWHERYERHSANQDGLMQILRLNAFMDARGVLDRIEAPTLITHRTDDMVVDVRFARELAAALPSARLVERPGRDHYTYATDDEALEAFQVLSETEGIIPALESAHAVAEAIKRAQTMRPDQILVVNLSGRGDKDLDTVINALSS